VPFLQKIIWTCWFQGREQMPPIVEKCVNSWEIKNPDWQTIVVTRENAGYYVPEVSPFLERQDISWTQKSDILRLHLLKKHSGVWCDASTFCNKPLSQWLPEYLTSGFFAFQRTDRYLLSSWFLAAAKNNLVINEWKSFMDKYYQFNFRRTQTPGIGKVTCASTSLGDKLTEFIDKKNISTSIWFSWFFTRVLRISPYFCVHYAFEYLYRHNTQFRQIWDNTPKINADTPHAIQGYGMFREDIDPIFWNEILSQKCPVYKLQWKSDKNGFGPNCLISKLFEIK